MTDLPGALDPAHQTWSHPDDDTLADRAEGLLDPDRDASIATHLAGCPRCAGRADAIAGIPALLASVSDTGPVPPDVADRLDRALSEARLPTGSRTVVPAEATAEHRSPLGMRVLQAAAVLVLLLAGVGIAVSAFQSGDSGESDVEAGSSAQEQSGAESDLAGANAYPVSASGRNWSQDSVTKAVRQIVGGTLPPATTAFSASSADSSAAPEAGRSLGAERLAGGPALADCVTALNDDPVTPLGVDLATFEGNPAAVIVLPALEDPARAWVWVVEPDCSQKDAKLLYFAQVDRP